MTGRRQPAPLLDAPSAPASDWVATIALPAETRTVVLIGSDGGRAIAALRARHPNLRLLVLEPDSDAARQLQSQKESAAAGGVTMVVGGPGFGAAATVAKTFPDLHTAPVVVSPRLETAQPAAVAQAREAVRRLTFQSSANAEAKRASEGRYLLHTLANGPRLARESDVADLDGLAAGMPAIIAAAGPSLDRNVHDLAAVRDRAVVIACDTAARPLLNLLVDVDFIVAADPSRANAAHLSSLPPTPAWIVAEGSVHPSALVHGDGRTFFFRVANHQPWPWLQSIGLDVSILETWGSVATSALSLALRLGCDPIIFIGADFAFTGGRPYCRGTTFESLWGLWMGGGASEEAIWQMLIDRWPPEHQPNLERRPERTARHLVAFRDWIVERASRPDCRPIVNATGAGLLVGPGITQQSAATTLANASSIDRTRLHDAIRSVRKPELTRLERWLSKTSDIVDGRGGAESLLAAVNVAPHAVTAALRSREYFGWALARGRRSASGPEGVG